MTNSNCLVVMLLLFALTRTIFYTLLNPKKHYWIFELNFEKKLFDLKLEKMHRDSGLYVRTIWFCLVLCILSCLLKTRYAIHISSQIISLFFSLFTKKKTYVWTSLKKERWEVIDLNVFKSPLNWVTFKSISYQINTCYV